MRYLDASIFLCVMLKAPKDKFEDVKEIMVKISQGSEHAITTIFTLAEIAHILQREKIAKEKIKIYLSALLGCGGLKMIGAEDDILSHKAVDLSTKYDIDFVDAHHILTMRKLQIKEIYSLDPHFDMFKDIIRRDKLPE